jgi:tetratricopeptide (TPR) repeat protein
VPLNRDATLKQAEKLLRQGRLDGAIAEYLRLVADQPRDWTAINALGDLYVRAGDPARAAEQFTRVADHMFAEGFLPKASALYKKALRVKPDHEPTLLRLSEIAAQQGLLVDARQYLKQLARLRRDRGDQHGAADVLARMALLDGAETAATADSPTSEADRLFALGREALVSGRADEAQMAFTRVMTVAPTARDALQTLAVERAAAGAMAEAFVCTEVLVDDAVLAGDWDRALTSLEMLLQSQPYLPALLKMVELAVDAGRADVVDSAQVRLAHAYMEVDKAVEARAIAEDLVARYPYSAPHAELLRQVLARVGADADADAILERYRDPAAAEDDVIGDNERIAVEVRVDDRGTDGLVRPIETEPDEDAIVLDALEIDLSRTLADLGSGESADQSRPEPAADLDAVFDDMRRRATQNGPGGDGSADYARALRQIDEGRLAEAATSLRAAARRPLYRFRAAARLGRLCLAQGETAQAIEWLERAAEAPASTAEDGWAVLYDLAQALHGIGEGARALAVLLELEADAGTYRDVRQRIELLSRAETGPR